MLVGEKSSGYTELMGLGPYVLETWWDSTILVRVEGGWAVGLIHVERLLVQAIPPLAMDFQHKNAGTSVREKSLKSTQKAKVLAPSLTPMMTSHFFTCNNNCGWLKELVTPTSNLVWEHPAHLLTTRMTAVLGSSSESGRECS